MVTFLVCLVVVGGALILILAVTLEDVVKPATDDAASHRQASLRSLAGAARKATAFLIPTDAAVTSRIRTEPAPAAAGHEEAEAEAEAGAGAPPVEPAPAVRSDIPPRPALPRAPRPTFGRRVLARLRGTVKLVVLLVMTGMLLAAVVGAAVVAFILGVRAAIGS